MTSSIDSNKALSPKGSFSYVFIPADEQSPIEQRQGDKSGGLQDDDLIKTAKNYFFQQSGGAARADALQNAPPEEQRAIAEKMRSQILAGNPNAQSQLSKMDDTALLNLVRSTQAAPSCEIMALTVPTKGNQFRAVSMYASDAPGSGSSSSSRLQLNTRATALLQACGHAPPQASAEATSGHPLPPGVYGDVFVGRCEDNEATDVWQRVDMTIADVQDPARAEWCAVARNSGGGGGTSSSSSTQAASLSGIMQQTVNSSGVSPSNGVTWNQTNDEVQIDFVVAKGTKAKYVKVAFGMDSLKVVVAGQTLLQGRTGGTVNVDECTYTLQDTASEGAASAPSRDLCVILSKKDPGAVWPHAVQPSSAS